MAIIDLTQGAHRTTVILLNGIIRFERNVQCMVAWKIIISTASTSNFVIRKIKSLRRDFKPAYLCIFSYGDTVSVIRSFSAEIKAEKKNYFDL